MNTKLLLEIKEKILAEPCQFQMWSFYRRKLDYDFVGCKYKIPNCGTAACIAGWATCINKKITPNEARLTMGFNIWDYAANLLNITPDKASILFEIDNWPKQFQYGEEHTPEQRAKLAAARIDYFIETDGE